MTPYPDCLVVALFLVAGRAASLEGAAERAGLLGLFSVTALLLVIWDEGDDSDEAERPVPNVDVCVPGSKKKIIKKKRVYEFDDNEKRNMYIYIYIYICTNMSK